ncbi:Elongation factor 3 [Picochlorum sp. SENEW3]|nr:Elongation factor 3 [Picochlorum sp. SENEW3]
MTSSAAAKPGGIRIVRASKPVAAADDSSANKAAEVKQEASAESCFNDYLIQAEGDVEMAAEIVAEKMKEGEVKAGTGLPALVEYVGVGLFMRSGLSSVVQESLQGMHGVDARRVSLKAVVGMALENGKAVEPFLMSLSPHVLGCFDAKESDVREAAEKAGSTLMKKLNAHATTGIIETLLQFMTKTNKWQIRVGALKCLDTRASEFPGEMGHSMHKLIPSLSEAVVDSRMEVAETAKNALLACCYAAGNRDLDPNVPAVVSCIAHPTEVTDLVAKLSATTFVQTMEDACMAVLVPIMDRALKERSTKTQRRACIIIENMSKLVLDPVDARPFLPVLIPALDKVSDQAADPELRDVAARASGALKKIRDEDEAVAKVAGIAASKEEVFKELSVLIDKADFPADAAPAVDSAAAYVANVCASLIRSHIHGPRSWDSACFEYLNPASGDEEKTKELTVGLRKWALTHMGEVVQEEEEFDDELCNCEFSLAYGGRILLTNTTLRLRRGRRYGLCGANGAGKSTLMKAIANGQLDGFPPKEELRTVYVAHDIDASVSETPVVDFIFEDEVVQEAQSPSREKVIEVLAEVGFSDQLQAAPIASLSGGWRMKLALARAMLIGADILLLDEPTNHMDTTNVAWLVDYLTKKTDISSMIVSHDSGFLDDVCTDIIHYEKRKLVHYVGNLSEFVKVKPEAKAYYELSAAAFKFTFPEPGFLDGVKGKRQPVIRVLKMSFTYPGAPKPQISDVTVRCTLGSRVAVIGRNGAGKSTLIKVITGETLPTEGTVWRHPNLRIAYVAQHAFHHIEDHLEKTPAQYIWWRFGDGEDREAKEKATRKLTDEEIKAREDAIAAGKRVVDFLNSRRMGNKSKEYEYEVQWYGQSSRENVWYTRTKLVEEMGLGKLVEEMDAKIANFRNYRALSNPMVIQHLKDFGLEEEIAAHNMIRGLSGGQKVKLVLAAAMWCQPHLLVLDEPTNYLDRDSLGALASGIKEYNGGVLMISHNNEFTSALCSEEWIVADGKVTVKGQQISEVPSVQSLASMTTASSVASLSTLGGESVEDDEHLDGAALEEKLKAKEERRLKKERLAAEKAAKKAEKARLKFLKKF